MLGPIKRVTLLAGITAVGGLLLLFPHLTTAGDDKTKKKVYNYVGAKSCKVCHNLSKYGAQYKVWEKMPHARAFLTLQTAAADSIAGAQGLDAPAAESPECLSCHTTAYGESKKRRGKKLTLKEGVSCEACHSAGSGYKKTAIMKKIAEGQFNPESVGLVNKPGEAVCMTCHNEDSPTYRPFDFETDWASINHVTRGKAPTE